MALEVLFFGSLTDASLVPALTVNDMVDTNEVKRFLEEKYPTLISAKYFMAVNQKMIQTNTLLQPGDTVALMPPFSGG